MKLRDYQISAIDSIEDDLTSNRSALLLCATGGGKTVMFSEVARRWVERGHRVMVVAHMRELLDQAHKKLNRFSRIPSGSIGYDIADRQSDPRNVAVTLASMKTLRQSDRLRPYLQTPPDLIIDDECDFATPGKWEDIYNPIREVAPELRILGVTATAHRQDGIKLKQYYDTVSDTIGIRDLIEQGYLVPIRQTLIESESIDLSGVRITSKGDFNERELSEVMESERAVLEVAQVALQESGDRPTLVFCTSVEQAKRVSESLNLHRSGSSTHISGETADRDGTLYRFRSGGVQFLCNCLLMTRGVDLPFVSHLVNARPTKSLSLYTQIVGRVLRLNGQTMEESIDNGKPYALVTDITGVSELHNLITAVDLLAETAASGAKERAQAILRRQGGGDIAQALKVAENETMESERKRLIAAGAKYEKRRVDPFAVVGIIRRPGYGESVTPRQAATLEKFGIDPRDISEMDKQTASQFISNRIEASQRGQATYKQVKLLSKYGIPPDVSFQTARKLIDLISSNNWRPAGIEHEIHNILSDDPFMREAIEGVI